MGSQKTIARTSKTAFAALAGLIVALLLLGGCAGKAPSSNETSQSNDDSMTAIVAYAQDGNVLLVDQATNTPFIPTIPEGALVGLDGNPIEISDLSAGNVIEVVGNGIMLESYPAQYPGIISVTVLELGDPADAEPFADIVAAVFAGPDPAMAPIGAVEYTDDFGTVTLALDPYRYNWYGSDSEHSEESVLDGSLMNPSGFLYAGINDAQLAQSTEGIVTFDRGFQSFQVNRTILDPDSSQGVRVDLKSTQEPVEAVVINEGQLSLILEPGYVYELTVEFANGQANYAFYTGA